MYKIHWIMFQGLQAGSEGIMSKVFYKAMERRVTNIIIPKKHKHQLTLNFSQKCNTIQLAQTMLVPKFVKTQEKINNHFKQTKDK